MIKQIATHLSLPYHTVSNVIKLFNNGATIPFIARYRKEATGNMNEQVLELIEQEYQALQDLEKRKEYILKVIEEQGKLTKELKQKIEHCNNAQELEDIYLPYKSKRKTKAESARLMGLEPLAEIIFKQKESRLDGVVQSFLNKEVKNKEAALEGARFIIAEWINESASARNMLRKNFFESAQIVSAVKKGKQEVGKLYADYFSYSSNLASIPSHRLLAILRAENEGILNIQINIDNNKAISLLKPLFVKAYNDCSYQVFLAIQDSFDRLLWPSISNEFLKNSKDKADKEAIEVFAENLRQLLMEAPLGTRNVMGVDPGYRTGCKVACINAQGSFTAHTTIYPNAPQLNQIEAKEKVLQLIENYKIEAIAIGNGTASRDTEYFIKDCVAGKNIDVFIVNEAGASIYSASEIARTEFPDLDVTVRGAISIARRLQDPLAELLKIDPKSIGVGQYQHDVNQTKLKQKLDNVVVSVVNNVGVQVNTASAHLLQYISGIGPKMAQNVVDYRNKNGFIKSRNDLKKVSGLGDKAFELSAGFIRIRESKNPLDNTAVHPERYTLVKQIAKDLKVTEEALLNEKAVRDKIVLNNYVNESTSMHTLEDIILSMSKSGLDPRGEAQLFSFAKITDMQDLKEGMVVPGIVNNVANFGAFVDIGIKENGLIHISEVADTFVDDIHKVLKVNQKVEAKIIGLDFDRNRIQLSLKK